MTLIDVQLALSTDHLAALRTRFQQARDLTHRAVRRDLVPFARHFVDKTLRVEPGPSVNPVRWTPSRHAEDAQKPPNTPWGYYSRQKTAYFATDGFGAGIPYVRQHKIHKGWHVIGNYEGGFGGLRVTHDSRIAKFVYGPWQQEFHAITGWPHIHQQLQILSLQLDERIEQIVYWVGVEIAQGGSDDAL